MCRSKLVKDAASLSNFIKNLKCFDRHLQQLKVLSIYDGNLQAEIKVSENRINAMGHVHNGFFSLLFDSASYYTLMSKFERPMVSVDIHMSFFKSGKVGDDLLVDVQTVRCGKTFAFLKVFIKNKATGDLLVKGSHTVYISPEKKIQF